MIELHRLNDTKILINADLIESVEEMPDTVISLTNGHKYIVKESIKQILDKIIAFRQNISIKTSVRGKKHQTKKSKTTGKKV